MQWCCSVHCDPRWHRCCGRLSWRFNEAQRQSGRQWDRLVQGWSLVRRRRRGGDLANQPVRAGGLEPRLRAGRVAGKPRFIWVCYGTTADRVAPVTWLAEREHAVMNQATLHGPTKWKGVIRICGHLEGHHNRLNFRARSHRGCCEMSKGRVCGAGVDAGVGWEVSGGWRWREVVLWMDTMSLSTRSNFDLDLDGRCAPDHAD